MRLTKELTNIVENLENLLSSEKIELIAKSSNFVKRKSPLSGCPFLYLNMSSIGSTGFCSLTESCIQLSKEHGIKISKQGLDERYHKESVKFVKEVLSKLLRLRLDSISSLDLGILRMFKGVYLRDATTSQLPKCLMKLFKGSGGSASKAAIKVELQYDLIGETINMEFRNGASSDSTSLDNEYKAGSLYLQDLGYFKIGRFAKIIKSKASFISRYKHNTNIYLGEGSSKKSEKSKEKQVKLEILTKGMKVNDIRSTPIYLGMYQRLPVRLVIQKLPRKVADKRKRKVKEDARRKGYTASKERLKAAAYSFFITNIDIGILSAKQIIQTYKIRCLSRFLGGQIEIMFKCWKSIMSFGETHPMKPQRFLCMLYGQMIWITLTMKMTNWFKKICQLRYKIELSELKSFKLLKIYQDEFIKILITNDYKNKDLEHFIHNLFQQAFIFAEKECKKNNPNPLFATS